MFRYKEVQLTFSDIFRVFISGSSSAGKTYFAKKLLNQNLFKFQRVYYFHPDFHETAPINWPFDIIFHSGLPSLEDLLAIPEYSCVILDDLYHECVNSSEIDYLYRVLSSKRKLHCIVMTQRYFAQGKFALNIRNSSNYHILMRNADERTNLRAADTMNLKREIIKANECNENEMFPYIFIDKTNYARVTGLKVYVDIFSKYRKAIMKSNLFYLIGEKDFESRFHKVDENVANENTSSRIRASASDSEGSKECSRTSDDSRASIEPGTTDPRVSAEPGSGNSDPRTSSSAGPRTSSSAGPRTGTDSRTDSPTKLITEKRYSRRELKRRIKQAVYRHKQRPVV